MWGFRKKQTDRKSALLESCVKVEHSNARTVLEVTSQETFRMMKFGADEDEVQ